MSIMRMKISSAQHMDITRVFHLQRSRDNSKTVTPSNSKICKSWAHETKHACAWCIQGIGPASIWDNHALYSHLQVIARRNDPPLSKSLGEETKRKRFPENETISPFLQPLNNSKEHPSLVSRSYVILQAVR